MNTANILKMAMMIKICMKEIQNFVEQLLAHCGTEHAHFLSRTNRTRHMSALHWLPPFGVLRTTQGYVISRLTQVLFMNTEIEL